MGGGWFSDKLELMYLYSPYSNGLLRQYSSKGMELTEVTQEQVQWAVDRLNHRSKKVLGFRTPFEVFFGKTVR